MTRAYDQLKLLHPWWCTPRLFRQMYRRHPAKAATVVCVIGLGFGLGSYFLYKLYCRFIRGEVKKPPGIKSKKNSKADENFNQPKHLQNTYTCTIMLYLWKSTNEEEEESDMGNSQSHDVTSVSYDKANDGVTIGNKRSTNGSARRRNQRLRSKSNDRMPNYPTDSSRQIPVNYDERLVHSASDLNEASPICGSLKGNLSLRSLYERNSKYGYSPDEEINNQSNSFEDTHKNQINQSNDSLQIDVSSSQDVLDYSSVLLTPPSDDESIPQKENWDNFVLGQNNEKVLKESSDFCENSIADRNIEQTQIDTKNNVNCSDSSHGDNIANQLKHSLTEAAELEDDFDDTSELWKSSEKSDLFKSLSDGTTDYSGSISLEDEERDMPSPLRKAKTEKQFKQSLLRRLNDYATVSGSSNSTSQDSTPDRSPFRRSSTGCSNYSFDRQDSLSGFGTPDSELFGTCDVEDTSTEHHFEEIETELQDVETEFDDIMSQLHHLKSLGANYSDSVDDSVEYQPHDPLAKKVCKIVEKTRHKVERSRSHSLSPIPSVGNSFNVSCDIPDLSWDTEGMSKENSPQRKSQNKSLLNTKLNISDSGNCTHENKTDNSNSEKLREKISQSKLQDSALLESDDLDTDGYTGDIIESQRINHGDGACAENKDSKQIGEKLDIITYAAQEWKGETQTARTIKQAYKEIPNLLHCSCLRRIRGDNYCGIRGTLFQFLSNGIKLKNWSNLTRTLDMLNHAYQDKTSGLTSWTFANRLPHGADTLLSKMSDCVSTLISTRVLWTVKLLNSGDVKLMEGLKLLMFLNIYNLNKCVQHGDDVPVFVWLLLARDTSENPALFIKNHLNQVGNSAGLEQVEMFLLGHTLGVTIQVVRLLQYKQEDFISYYPDEYVGLWPQVSLLAEDDRHYNVPVP
ncbi:hypothetical protein KUTeg_023704 [Tegillarca granosa]|uniref:Uncharacterized protein n=1 Tax=Tegillarca granosa TaxID=220873 RepID=A0ABQ9E2F2_TEGGR|nr:hypothetical protein KUTeg_023704 [Tegillarca granosa]